jgi:hypothetical protein
MGQSINQYLEVLMKQTSTLSCKKGVGMGQSINQYLEVLMKQTSSSLSN